MEMINKRITFNDKERAAIKQLIDKRCGIVTTSKHYTSNDGSPSFVEEDILNKTGIGISGSTLKRLVGLTGKNYNISQDNLKVVAKYLRFDGVNSFIRRVKVMAQFKHKTNGGFLIDDCKIVVHFEDNDKYQIVLELINGSFLKVISVSGFELISPDDELDVEEMKKNKVFKCKDVIRTIDGKGTSMGIFTTAEHKVSLIELE
jgi:hypothetical protein